MTTCSEYSKGYCAGIIDYTVAVASNLSIPQIELALKSHGIEFLISLNQTAAYEPCIDAYVKNICYSAYPSCLDDAVQYVACKTTCENAYNRCKPLFAMFGKLSALPNCTGNVFGAPLPYSPDTTTCLGRDVNPVTPLPIPNSNDNATTVQCPSFLLPNPLYDPSNPSITTSLNDKTCVGSCCVPCPYYEYLYPPGTFANFASTQRVLNSISLFAVLIIALPGYFSHQFDEYPGYMLKPFAVGVFVLHGSSLLTINYKGVACRDAVTHATQQNSLFCLVQGFINISATTYLVFWISLFTIALHLMIVRGNTYLQDKFIHVHVFSWVLSLGVASAYAGFGFIRFGAASCGQFGQAMYSHLAIILLMGLPATGMNLYTVWYMIRVQILAPSRDNVEAGTTIPTRNHNSNNCQSIAPQSTGKSKGSHKFTTNSFSTAASDQGGNRTERIDRFIGKLLEVWNESGRLIALCAVFFSMLTAIVAFNFYITYKSSDPNLTTSWIQDWYTCALANKTQSDCADVIQPHIPIPESIWISTGLMNTIGLAACCVMARKVLANFFKNRIEK